MAILVDLQIEAEEAMVLLPVKELTAPGLRVQSRLQHLSLKVPHYLA